MKALELVSLFLCSLILSAATGCVSKGNPETHDDGFPDVTEDVFHEMDGGIELSADEIRGRNTWILWSSGNDEFWDRIARRSRGMIDLLKMLDSRNRGSRFEKMGLINEPGFREAGAADQNGIWLDERVSAAPEGIDEEVYGRSSGVIGFRIFPNPDFDEKARAEWNADQFYSDPTYTAKPDLVRPYRVGVTCAACHVAPHPLYPPKDPEFPEWRNLASAIGNQYLQEGRVFAVGARPGSFFKEMLETQPRGTSDTSRVATDNINNPNAINSIFLLDERLRIAQEEILAGETLLLPGTRRRSRVPHILKDGADSVGVVGAAIRVYVNLGLFHSHWLERHQALIGLKPQKPFSIRLAQKQSAYWRATERKIPDIGKFFARLKPMKLVDAPGGAAFVAKVATKLERGRVVFARHCAGCHSSRQPPPHVSQESRADWFEQESAKPEFWKNNFLSDDRRHPVTVIQTNAARACATNAMRGHIWENFSSETYKTLPPPPRKREEESSSETNLDGVIDVWNPYTRQTEPFRIQGGGPGYYRTPSLVSVWATAPLLHNNTLGKFTGDPSVKGRVETFEDAIEKLLWPEKRLGKDSIWRTAAPSFLEIPRDEIPKALLKFLGADQTRNGVFRLGPVPVGTPVNLLANIDPSTDPQELARVGLMIKKTLATIAEKHLDADAAKQLMKTDLAPLLFRISKCPDLEEDRGHYFGTDLPDSDKHALIEFLKTL